MKQVIYRELCAGAWAIPPSPLMVKNGNTYHTCSICSEPCEDPKPEAMEAPKKLYQLTEVVFGSTQQTKDSVGEISDGYHTFNELYAYRMAYNALLFNEWFKAGKNDVHWSRRHSDGELCFGGGWFVVVAQTQYGQITNHYELKDLQWFAAIEERETAAEWDGHTPEQAFDRLRQNAWHFSIPF